jgi:hypothetical protein
VRRVGKNTMIFMKTKKPSEIIREKMERTVVERAKEYGCSVIKIENRDYIYAIMEYLDEEQEKPKKQTR